MNTHRVMLVDDDETTRTLLRMTLPQDGFDIVEAGDGEDALERLGDGAVPDLIVLDWKMPARSGAEVLATVKERHPDLAVVVLTAEKNAASRERAHELGADAFLTKPFSPLELLGVVERFLGRA